MKISFVVIQNFRKLKSCQIEFADEETVFVGANNSGKTSAMDALMLFLGGKRKMTTMDFTLSNWRDLNQFGKDWIKEDIEEFGFKKTLDSWRPYLPALDVWIEVGENQIYYVSHLIPTLNWNGGKLGVRLIYEPQNIKDLYKDYRQTYRAARENEENSDKLSLWPKNMKDFLDKKLSSHFAIMAYLLDNSKSNSLNDEPYFPQELSENNIAIDQNPFKGLIKFSTINAQRGFSDVNGEQTDNVGKLSTQLRSYYSQHINPYENPSKNDIDAINAIEEARTVFDKSLHAGFKEALGELETMGYPGFADPQIFITSKIDPVESINHETAVQFRINNSSKSDEEELLKLPEKYNGLGYQNLVSMVFSLMRFRDEWMRKGKTSSDAAQEVLEPLHIVLIEEPEAHLHAQVQQVFIKKAYAVLRNHKALRENKYNTQLIVSTHSSHIAHEVEFSNLRYFQRALANSNAPIPYANVINLSTVFGNEEKTSKFVSRYLKTTHCDLFFADGLVLVEGPAERLLIPHFIKKSFPTLDSRYITLLEIGGSHAHRLRPLIETLGIYTLVITDIDSIESDGSCKVLPAEGKGYETRNHSLKEWCPCKKTIDELYECEENDKITNNHRIRMAYQIPIRLDGNNEDIFPYTFEDSLVFTNRDFFKSMDSSIGLMRKISEFLKLSDIQETHQKLFEALKTGKKAEMALELLYHKEPEEIKVPQYIAEGLTWLENSLKSISQEQ